MSEEDEIHVWEYVNPLDLVKAIDETMRMVKGNPVLEWWRQYKFLRGLGNNPEWTIKDLKEQTYNLLFLIRQNTMMLTGFIKILGTDKAKEIMKENSKTEIYS